MNYLGNTNQENKMGSLTRAPKIKKPSKGMKNFLKQGVRGLKKAVRSLTKSDDSHWYNAAAARHQWLSGFHGGHTVHQGGQEKARRVRQMKEHKCINPEVWA